MKKNLLFLCLLFNSFLLNAQLISVVEPLTISTCDTNEFNLQIINNTGSPMSGESIIINFDEDASLFSDSSFIISNDSAIFSNISIAVNDTLIIDYSLYFPCGMIPNSTTASLFSNTLIHFNAQLYTVNKSLEYPHLIRSSATVISNSSHQGASFSREIEIINTGTGAFSGAFSFFDSLSCNAVHIDTIRIIDENNNIIAQAFDTNYIEIDSIFLNNTSETFYIEEVISVDSCFEICFNPNEIVRSYFEINWGCNLNDLCRDISNLSARILRDNSEPKIIVYRRSPGGSVPFENICISSADSIDSLMNTSLFNRREFVMVNEGSFPAYDINFILSSTVNNNNDLLFGDNVYAINTNNDTLAGAKTYAYFNTECYNKSNSLGLKPIKRIKWKFDKLDVNDTIYIVYNTFRCCPEDEIYFNQEAYFDTWKFSSPQDNFYSNECGVLDLGFDYNVTNPHKNFGVDIPNKNLYKYHYSPNAYHKASKLNLEAESITPISDLSGKTGECSPSNKQNFQILCTDFVGSALFYSDSYGDTTEANFKIDIILQKGLIIDSSHFNDITIYNPFLSSYITIDSFTSNSLNPDSSIFSIYYSVDSFLGYGLLKNFMVNSLLTLPITPCCPSLDDGPASFFVKYNVNLKPNDCETCWIPLGSAEKLNINIHCPGCVTPGIIVNKVNIERTNFGWLDLNNNGLIDFPYVKIDSAEQLVFNPSKYIAMPGDTLHTEIGAFFVDGNNNGGFNYQTWLNHWSATGDTLDKLYMDLDIPCSDTNGFNWKVINDSIRIYDSNIASWSDWISIDNMYERTAITFFYKIPIDSIRGKAGIAHDYYYDIDDKFEYKIDFRISGNDASVSDYEDCAVNCFMWLAGSDMANNAFQNITIVPDTTNNIDPLLNAQQKVPLVGPEFIFNCEAFASTLALTRFFVSTSSVWYNATSPSSSYTNVSLSSCKKFLKHTTRVNTGCSSKNTDASCSGKFNYYRYEFRPLNIDFNIDITIPNNYSFSSLRPISIVPLYTNSVNYKYRQLADTSNQYSAIENIPNILNVSLENSPYQYVSDNFSIHQNNNSFNSGHILKQDTLLSGDEKFMIENFIYFVPDTLCNMPHTQIINEPITTYIDLNLDDKIDTIVQYKNDTLKSPRPKFDIPQDSVIVLIDSFNTCFNFLLKFDSDSYFKRAQNVFMYIDTPSNVNLTYTNNHFQTAINNSINGITKLGSWIYQTSQLHSANFKLCVNLDTCFVDSNNAFVNIPIIIGSGCYGYPNSIADSSICSLDTFNILLELVPVGLSQGPVTQDSIIAFCDTVNMAACTYLTEHGNISSLFFDLELPAGAQLIDSPIVSFPSHPSFPAVYPNLIETNGQSNKYAFPNAWQLAEPYDSVCVAFSFIYKPACGPEASYPPNVDIGGQTYCGDQLLSLLIPFDTLDVQGNNCPSINTYGDQTNTICNENGAIDVTVSGYGPFSYLWNPTNDTIQDIDSLNAQDYNITIVDANGCDTTLYFQLSDSCYCSIDTSIAITEDSCSATVLLTSNATGVTYLWSTGDTTESIIVNQIGTYWLILDSVFCKDTVYVNINSLPTSIPNAIVIGTHQNDTTYLSNLINNGTLPPSILQQENVIVNGILIIDTTSGPAWDYISLINDFYFGPGAGIDVVNQSNFYTFLGIYTTFNSLCDTMWRGLKQDHNASMYFYGVSINDAHYGIEAGSKSRLNISHAHFNDNFIGIFLPPVQYNLQWNSYLPEFRLVNSKFESTTGLINTYTGQSEISAMNMEPPLKGRKSFSGIWAVNNAMLNIQNDNSINYFNKLHNGIVALNYQNSQTSNLYVQDAEFNDIVRNINGLTDYGNSSSTLYFGNENPTAIKAITNHNNLQSSLAANNCRFNNASIGILNMYNDAKIIDNDIESPYVGIYNLPRINGSTFIEDNELDISNLGILYGHSFIIDTTSISANEIFMNQAGFPFGMGIVVSDYSSSLGGKEIRDNYIEIDSRGLGILSMGGIGTRLINNEIKMMPNASNTAKAHYGIYSLFSRKAIIARNIIYYNSLNNNNSGEIAGGNHLPVALEIFGCDEAIVQCNDVEKTYTGIRFNGSSTGIRVAGNSFNTHNTGLKYASTLISNGTIIQDNTGNSWQGTFANPNLSIGDGGGAFNKHFWSMPQSTPAQQAQAQQVLLNQEYKVSNSSLQPTNYYPSPTFSNPFLNWFPPTSTAIVFDCATMNPYSMVLLPPHIPTLEKTAKGELDVAIYKTELNKQEQRQLYDNMKKDISLHSLSTKVDSFYTHAQTSQLKDMYEAQEKVSAIREQAPTEKTALALLQNEMEQIRDSIIFKDSLFYEIFVLDTSQLADTILNIDTTAFAAHHAQKAQLYSLLEAKQTIAGQKSTIINTQSIAKAEEAILRYDAFTENEAIDAYQKFTSKMWIKHVLKGIALSTYEKQELLAIANICPLEGGSGVVDARSLLTAMPENLGMYWEDFERCERVGFDIRKTDGGDNSQALVTPKHEILIYPNPAKEKLYIKLDQGYDKLEIKVNGILGNLVHEKEILAAEGIVEINLKKLSFGTYTISIYHKNEEIHGEKLIIK